ncbi:MAG: outer membrane lipoprotein-sorting protein [Myxococcota bacterium]|jgi:outer membrane lipoprotein-sorting protein
MEPTKRPGKHAQTTLLLSVVFAVLASACPSPRHAPPSEALTDASEVLALAQAARATAPKSLIIEARATQYSTDGALKGTLDILVRRPAAVHFSALSPTGDVLSVLGTDGNQFTSFERGASVCYTGRACPQNVGRLVPMAMEPATLAAVLMGEAPIIAHTRKVLEWDTEVGTYRLVLTGNGATEERLWVDHKTGKIRRAELRENGKVTVTLRYSEYGKVGSYTLPKRLNVKMARRDVDLQIDYREVDADLDINDSAFVLTCPKGARVETLPCP